MDDMQNQLIQTQTQIKQELIDAFSKLIEDKLGQKQPTENENKEDN